MSAVQILPVGRPTTMLPLSATRDLEACPVANTPLGDLVAAEWDAAGVGAGWQVLGNTWIDRADLAAALAGNPARLVTAAGIVVAERPARGGSGDAVVAAVVIRYPWDLLGLNERLLGRVTASVVRGRVSPHADVLGTLILGEGSEIRAGVVVEGVAVIGCNTTVGPNSYLRGCTAIGDNCHVGHAVEIKNSILFNRVGVSHLSYVGDSVLGEDVNFGGGTITANFRHDAMNHRSLVDGELVDTGRRKFGTVCGDGVHTGINTSIYPGRKLWPRITTLPGDVVRRDLS